MPSQRESVNSASTTAPEATNPDLHYLPDGSVTYPTHQALRSAAEEPFGEITSDQVWGRMLA